VIVRLLVCTGLLVACNKGKVDWSRFNSEDDFMEVHVTESEALVDIDGCDLGTVCIDLHSRIEGAVIGTASVDPGSGPVGTRHKVLAVVGDDWEDQVGRVSVEITGPRGPQEYELEQDRANPGAWGLTIQSVGAIGKAGEDRLDTVYILLWEADENDEDAGEDEA